MNDPFEPAEPLPRLPAPPPRYFGEYKPVDPTDTAPPPTNVGGYDELLQYFRVRGQELPRTPDGLAAIDALIDSTVEDGLTELARPIGMFYGDVLTHNVPDAHWEATGGSPCVQVTKTVAVDVIGVAERRLTIAYPSLVQSYAHVLEIVARDA
ncbi:DUF6278 family protein [Paeniglutamicibacter sp. NPDC012692]|uniref:DUF6278 family protein n=1 Tax=Paeniglutamicibacter sp. NPDC012692 TaxID=3364388 RepID=UPI00367475C1